MKHRFQRDPRPATSGPGIARPQPDVGLPPIDPQLISRWARERANLTLELVDERKTFHRRLIWLGVVGFLVTDIVVAVVALVRV